VLREGHQDHHQPGLARPRAAAERMLVIAREEGIAKLQVAAAGDEPSLFLHDRCCSTLSMSNGEIHKRFVGFREIVLVEPAQIEAKALLRLER
jgi:hypothetical protein